MCQGAGEYFPDSLNISAPEVVAPPLRPGRESGLSTRLPTPGPSTSYPSRAPEPLSSVSAASARTARRADSVRTAAVSSRGAGAGAAARKRRGGRLSVNKAEFPFY